VANSVKHISVCVCTYKRPQLLKCLLSKLVVQDTNGLFTFSIVVADNDHLRSAEPLVSEFSALSSVHVLYCAEPQQSIALARNKCIQNASGEFVAFIDDDEFPSEYWLLNLFNTCEKYQVDGVLGPVMRHFDDEPPKWLLKSSLYKRPRHPTGFVVGWMEARTGNVLLRKRLFTPDGQPFKPEFRAGEDQDFFRRMITEHHVFIWCDEAVVYELVPPGRWKATVILRRALLRGATARLQPTCSTMSMAKSVIAVPVYTVALPVALLCGFHRFMTLLVKLCDHLGKLLAALNINVVKEPYVTE